MAIRIPLHYIDHDFSLPMEEVTLLRNKNFVSLLTRKKLHLVLDLDDTLVRCVKFIDRAICNKEKELWKIHLEKKDMYMISDQEAIKLRPGVREFLKEANKMFDLSVYTLGDRTYAHRVIRVLESEIEPVKFTCVMSKEDCLNQYRLRKGLGNLLSHARVVLIVDDNEIVWPVNKANLIQIGGYNFDVGNYSTRGDEDDGEFTRVLDILRMVHNEFYDDCGNDDDISLKKGEKDYGKKDVRHILENIKQRLKLGEVDSVSCELSHLNIKKN